MRLVPEVTGGADPKAFFVGPVVQGFVDGPSKLETVDFARFVPADGSLVRSSTGELAWDFGRGLVQAATWDQPYGFETQKQGEYERITSVGGYPPNVEKIATRVAIKGATGKSAVVLDENGYRTERHAEAKATGNYYVIRLPDNAICTLVEQ